MVENSDGKSEILALYQKTANEIIRYRDLEWKISLWAFSVSVGLISIASIGNISSIAKLGILIFSIFILMFSIGHTIYCHSGLTTQRKLLRNCELKLPKMNEILPEKLKKPAECISFEKGIWHLLSWILLNVLAIILVAIIYYFG